MAEPTPFARACLALDLLAIEPRLGGVTLRDRAGPVRDALLTRLDRIPLPRRRLHPSIADDALFGGLDLAATLDSGHLVQSAGILHHPALLLLSMAERMEPRLAARIGGALDDGLGHVAVALDEGAEQTETAPPALTERFAFHIDLEGVAHADMAFGPAPDLDTARSLLPKVEYKTELLTYFATLSLQFGIHSPRAPYFALLAARALAALDQRTTVSDDDAARAVQLTLAHRATQWPDPTPEEQPEQDDRTETDAPESEGETDQQDLPQELLLEAVRAMLPDDLLDRVAAQKARGARGSGSGSKRKGNRRGRPLPSRAGRIGDGARVDIVATLRCAAPWQTIRRKGSPQGTGLQIRPSDIRVKRYEDRSDRLLIFTVDASGSAALARLAEAKGAVELLLSQAYARRDHVALIAFRGTEAEVLLPPTRSLVQTKRRLAALPGGGGTPLAAGLQSALYEAEQARHRGLSPTVVLLTDGRANVPLDGQSGRARARDDAERMARILASSGIDSLVIDTGARPEQALQRLSDTLNAPYLALPRANAERLSASVSSALGD